MCHESPKSLGVACSATDGVGVFQGMTISENIQDEGMRPARLEAHDSSNGFEEFVRATGNQIFRSALLLTGSHHLAEDLTQTTYAKVYVAWSRVSAADSPMAYTAQELAAGPVDKRLRCVKHHEAWSW
jgi:hypothetical protein